MHSRQWRIENRRSMIAIFYPLSSILNHFDTSFFCSSLLNLRIDFERLQKSSEHVISADQHRQLNRLPIAKMFLYVRKYGIRHVDVARYCVRVGEKSALLIGK